MSDFSLGLSFSRDYYLECAEQFEGSCIDCVDQELSEFGGDAEDLAYELAYTRYALAREEVEIERLRSEVAELKAERDKIESALKKMISMYSIDDYICGEDRESKVADIFRRMMEESKS